MARVDDADVVVGDQGQRAATGRRAGVQDDRAGVGDRERAAGDDGVERVERRRSRASRRRSTARPRSGKPAGTPTPRGAGEDRADGLGDARRRRRGGRSPGTRRRARRRGRRCRRGGAGRPAGSSRGISGRRRGDGPSALADAREDVLLGGAHVTSPPTTSSRAGAGRGWRSCHQSRKVSFGGSGRSRMAVQPGTAAFANGPRPSRASRCAPS